MNINVLTLFPKMLEASFQEGVVGQAFLRGLLNIQALNPREFAENKHKSVDDKPFGGGDGMVMSLEPLTKAFSSIPEGQRGPVIYLTPQGQLWTDAKAKSYAKNSDSITLICGRYGGIDQRFINHFVTEEISIGNYVLSGGELAAMVLIDSIARYIPGVLGNLISVEQESFSQGYLEAPLFTRPNGHALGLVPEFLTSGHHLHIEQMRKAVGIIRTLCLRPDLLQLRTDELEKYRASVLTLSNQDLEVLGLQREQILKLKSSLP